MIRKIPGYEQHFVDALSLTRITKEDGLLTNCDIDQTGFLIEVLRSVKPRCILEVGTLCGHFDYLCLLLNPKVKIYTLDINDKSKVAVDLLRDKFLASINFVVGDSEKTLPECGDHGFDLAWIDGGHDYGHAFSDGANCARMGIPHLLFDDGVFEDVWLAANQIVTIYNYRIEKVSSDNRKIVYLRGC